MDTNDRSNANLPARYPVASLPFRDLTPGLPSHQEAAPALQVNPRVILRVLSRHWWRILALWLVVSAPLALVIYMAIQPTYEAVSLLRIESAVGDILAPLNRSTVEGQNSTYLKTQVGLISSARVLDPAIADPLVVNLPTIKKSVDAKSDLLEKLKVAIVENTNLIRVTLELPNSEEAVTIVQAVVQSYLAQNTDFIRSANRELTESLKQQLTKIETDILTKRTALKDLYKKGNVAILKQPADRLNANNDDGNGVQPTFTTTSEDHVQNMMAQIDATELELIEAMSMLEVKSNAYKAKQQQIQEPTQSTDRQQQALVEEEFKKDPDVLEFMREYDETREHLEHLKRSVRQPHDAARLAAQNQFDKLQREYNDLWASKYTAILERLTAGPIGNTQVLVAIEELEQKVDTLKKKKAGLAERFKVIQVEQKVTNDDTFEAAFLSHQIQSLQGWEETVKRNLEQLKFEAGQDKYRVVLVDSAAASKSPSNNKRLKYMAAAPVGVLFAMLGLFLFLEIKAERVADPDALSTRVRSEVYALPPLPTTRSVRRLDADDQIEQFIQRLDHLRFAVCGSPTELGRGRCVLITSAIGGEGKTTLAAQLAARCGNAGMSTLLIDSDFRRAGLCLLLDVPEGPGLSDVLKDETTIDEVAIPVQGGAFYLLPAGTPVQDTGSLLQSPKFGELMTQLRQRYDLIIIDSPPVLPVADALILGRWTDGAVIAARYDISRFPQVERARRQLDNAGITVLGTVINGMRNSDTYYGRYTYTRRRSGQPDSSNTI
jgi:polysaccharide biosynthesis transport protein